MERGMSGGSEPIRLLLERARAGDEQARDALFARYRAELERRARGRLPAQLRKLVDASDVVQDTVLDAVAVFEHFEYRGPDSFRRWLQRILETRLALAQRHYLGREKRDLAREVPLAPPDPERSARARSGLAASATSPSNRAIGDERRAGLLERLEHLPEDQRAVVRLMKLEERSLSEAAAVLGRSENAVKKLLARALVRLGEELRASGLEETR